MKSRKFTIIIPLIVLICAGAYLFGIDTPTTVDKHVTEKEITKPESDDTWTNMEISGISDYCVRPGETLTFNSIFRTTINVEVCTISQLKLAICGIPSNPPEFIDYRNGIKNFYAEVNFGSLDSIVVDADNNSVTTRSGTGISFNYPGSEDDYKFGGTISGNPTMDAGYSGGFFQQCPDSQEEPNYECVCDDSVWDRPCLTGWCDPTRLDIIDLVIEISYTIPSDAHVGRHEMTGSEYGRQGARLADCDEDGDLEWVNKPVPYQTSIAADLQLASFPNTVRGQKQQFVEVIFSDAGPNQSGTSYETFTLEGNELDRVNPVGDYTGMWTGPAGAVFSDATDYNSTVHFPIGISGPQTLTWTVTSSFTPLDGSPSCEESDDMIITLAQLGSLSGNVGEDINGDGVKQSNIAGVTITLQNASGAPFDTDPWTSGMQNTTVTDGNGNYSFPSLPAGGFRVVETDLPSYFSVSDVDGMNDNIIGLENTINVTLGNNSPNNDFIDSRYGSLSGTVYEDVNSNGTINPANDGKIENVQINLLDGAGNPVRDGMNNPITTTTNGNGYYEFTNLKPGSYQVEEVDLSIYYSVTDVDGTNDNKIGNTTTLSVLGNQSTDNQNFLDAQYGKITGYVYEDSDSNSDFSGGDTGIQGVILGLLDGSGSPVLDGNNDPITATTDVNGYYEFDNVEIGNYQVIETDKTGYYSIKDIDGGAGSNDDNIIGNNAGSPINILNGQTDNGNNFLDAGYGKIGDYVWYDGNNNGVQDGTENGLEGATVTIDPSGNADAGQGPGVSFSMKTDANGAYLFDNLKYGTFTITVDVSTITGGLPNMAYIGDLIQTYDKDGTGTANSSTSAAIGSSGEELDHDFGYYDDVLPVSWLAFEAVAEGESVLLSWSTSRELNNDRYEVQSSSNGLTYSVIGTVKGQGTSNNINKYNFTDKNPAQGVNYYRLKQIDYDNTSDFSQVRSVFFNTLTTANSLTVFPNPVDGTTILNVKGDIGNKLYIYNVSGALIKTIEVQSESDRTEISIEDLDSGIFYIKNESGVIQKFIVH